MRLSHEPLPNPARLAPLAEAGCAALALLLFAALARLAPETRRGQLLPFFESYEVAEVRLLGATVYADTSSGLADLVTVGALAAVAPGARPVRCPHAPGFAVGHDLLPLHREGAEEGAEVLAGLALLTGVSAIAAGQLGRPRTRGVQRRPPAG